MRTVEFDPAWISEAKEGNQEAITNLYNCSYQKVYLTIKSMLHADEDTVLDLLQDAFIKAFQSLDKLEEPDKFLAWIKSIARNTTLDHLKKSKAVLFTELTDADEDGVLDIEDSNDQNLPDNVIDRQETAWLLAEMLNALPEGQRAVISMHYYQDMSIREIANVLGRSENTIKVQLRNGRKAIEEKVLQLEKRDGIKLHGLAPFPFLLALLRYAAELQAAPDPAVLAGVLQASCGTAAAGTAAAAGSASTAAAAGSATGAGAAAVSAGAAISASAKLAAIPLAVKVAAMITAATVAIGGVTVALLPKTERPLPTETRMEATTYVTGDSTEEIVPTTGTIETTIVPVETTVPETTVPETTVPETTVPETTVPETTVPETTVPETTVPETTVPETTVPETTVPETTVPETTVPETTVPETTAPQISEPTEVTNLVPEGCTYITADGNTLDTGALLPDAPTVGDQLVTPNYTYMYGYERDAEEWTESGMNGWGVCTNRKDQESYPDLLPEIIQDPLLSVSYAFRNCENMVLSPEIPDTVVNMEGTFRGCASLSAMPEIPSDVVNMALAFSYCDSLVTVTTIPGSVNDLGQTFIYCNALTKTPRIESGVPEMVNTFSDCPALTEITNIPDSVTSLHYTFSDCVSLTEVPAFPKSITKMYGTFQNCISLVTSPSLPSNVEDIALCFLGCKSLTSAPSIPDSVRYMTHTFQDCTSLTVAPEIPGSVNTISYAFYGCTSLISAPRIPSNVWGGMENAFYGCTSLTGEIIIDADPYDSDYEACFEGTEKEIILTGASTVLEELAATAKNGNVIVKEATGEVSWDLSSDGTLTISGIGPMENYDHSLHIYSPWYDSRESITAVIIEEGVTRIGNDAFFDCSNLTSVAVPNSVRYIGEYAFYECSKLADITLPDSITEISTGAFSHCDRLTEIIIPDSVTSIGFGAFQSSNGLKEIRIPASVTSIDYYVFNGCASLTGIWVDAGNQHYTSDEYGVLFDKEQTKLIQAHRAIQGHYVIPETVKSIGPNAFLGCYNLAEITIPSGVIEIGSSAFQGCESLTSVTIPDSVTSIYGEAFSGCANLSTVILPSSITSFGMYAFSNTPYLESITDAAGFAVVNGILIEYSGTAASIIIPDNVTRINPYAFGNCSDLTEITVPASVSHIDDNSLTSCSDLEKVTFLGDAPTLESFQPFSDLAITIYYPAGNSTWKYSTMADFGGNITWVAYEPGE